MRKREKQKKCRYDSKVGMSIWRALPGLCLVISIFISLGINTEVSEQVKTTLIAINVLFLIVDCIVRIIHYRERRSNEQVGQAEQARFISKAEIVTYWLLKVGVPLYLIVMSLSVILMRL